MEARPPAALAALAALGLIFSPAAAGSQAASRAATADDSVVVAQLDEARAAANLGDWDGAALWLQEAADHDAGNSDALYLQALASVKRGLPLAAALGGLNAALASGRFSYYTIKDASLLKAELLVRERRWQEALDALGLVGTDAGADPAFRLIRARALAGEGDIRGLMSELSSAARRFPDASAFARLYLSKAGSFSASAEARELGATILNRLTRYSESDPELPVLAAPLMRDLESARKAVLAYRSAGLASPSATLRALEYGLIGEAAAAAELLVGAYPFSLGDLTSLLSLAGSPGGRQAVLAALGSWSGKVEVDDDRDGIHEASFDLERGLTTAWELDTKQEGRVDFRAKFSQGLPVEIVIDETGVRIDALYSVYPQLRSLAFDSDGERRGYAFAPEALCFAPIEMRPFAGSGRTALFLPYPIQAATPSERSCASAALSIVAEKGNSRTVTILDKGFPVSAVDYENGRIVSTTAYSRGLPLLRRIDADGDGRFESERRWVSDGTWIQHSDIDGDGVFEYSEQSAFPFRKEWDYDGNGSVDARRYQRLDGSTVEEFSSRLDGRLDERIVVTSGRIVALSRDGVSLALLPDSNPDLTWIGEKSFDLGRNLPPGEGIFKAMSRRYRLTRIGDLAFAEMIP